MNKQQLAAKIWESANKMRSKIEASEYKDYILGFMFYKFLSEKEVSFLKSEGFEDENLVEIEESDSDLVIHLTGQLGYFISYENLYQTWLKMGSDFNVGNVIDALNAFDRLIDENFKHVYDGIFKTLQSGLSKLGENTGAQTKAIRDLIQLIDPIPMDSKQDYDVLGFVYEYLISNFAANAGKKAGEFYTPHEVSLLMSEIISHHLKDKETIKIYDPTSGSGSLLINIGKTVSSHMKEANKVKYYAQELKENTYNLTRMNLVMRNILPNNIITRCGDTLEDDWPFFIEGQREISYEPVFVDAVVSNPPYSQKWEPDGKDIDVRFKDYGLAPKGKADYAFLLHNLYHLNSEGIMTIVLPHGVLFRGATEYDIRKKLIDKNKIDTIIGLPANIFFGTGIPTIVMVLKKERKESDVLIIDASKGFEKVGKNNQLRARDIKKIVDTVINRNDVEKFSRVVSKQEIIDNDYNLNIPRYVDSSEAAESWDIFSIMNGGIPKSEIELLSDYWDAFPTLKEELFAQSGIPYTKISCDNIAELIKNNKEVQRFKKAYEKAFDGFDKYLYDELINNYKILNINSEKDKVSSHIFSLLQKLKLVDKYENYQAFNDSWKQTAIDLEIMQTEGFDATKKTDPNMVTKKKDGKDVEVQEGYIGHVLPFDIVQDLYFADEKKALEELNNKLNEYESEVTEIIESFNEDEQTVLNEDNTAFDTTALKEKIKEVYADIEMAEIDVLNEYNTLGKKEKAAFVEEHPEIPWTDMEPSKDGPYAKKEVSKLIARFQAEYEFEEESFEAKVVKAGNLLEEIKNLKKSVKASDEKLHMDTKEKIESMTDAEVEEVLKEKWITSLINEMMSIPDTVVEELIKKVKNLDDKYKTTLNDVTADIAEAETSLAAMINDLTGSEFDMKGLKDFQDMLLGE